MQVKNKVAITAPEVKALVHIESWLATADPVTILSSSSGDTNQLYNSCINESLKYFKISQ